MAQLGATGYANQWRSQVYSNLRITQQIYKGLSVSGMFSFDTYNYTSNRFTKTPNTYHATGRDANGNLLYEQTRQGTENLAYSLSARVTAPSIWKPQSTTATLSAGTPYRA